jgi:pimeloyl-ACP methyl ester carboxylesterase
MTPDVIRANGVHFAYFDAGQGPLVLCLHGFPDTAWSFVPLLERLAAAGYCAVAPFMRGYPPSGPAPDGDYRVITLGRDALALIEALGAQRAVLVGHDWGAAATYIAAALAPAPRSVSSRPLRPLRSHRRGRAHRQAPRYLGCGTCRAWVRPFLFLARG